MKTLPKSVLLVEDAAVIVRQVKQSLMSMPLPLFKLLWCKTIAEASKQLNKNHIEIVLLDISMGKGMGLADFESLQHLAPRALFVLLCAKGDEPVAHQAMIMGASDYLDRQRIDADALARVINQSFTSRSVNNALHVSIAGLRAIGEASSMGIMISDLSGHITYTNEAYQRITGSSAAQLLGQYWAEFVYPQDRLRIQREWREALQVQKPFTTQMRMQRHNQSIRLVHVRGAFLHYRKDLYGHVRLFEDITAQVPDGQPGLGQEDYLGLPLEAQHFALNSTKDGIVVTDSLSNVVYLNPVAEQMTGWQRSEALGQNLDKVFSVTDESSELRGADGAKLAMEANKAVVLATDCVLTRRDGVNTLIESSAAPLHKTTGEISGAVLIFRTATPSAVRSLDTPLHDALTGLPNRLLFEYRLKQAIEDARVGGHRLAVLYVEIINLVKLTQQYSGKARRKLLIAVARGVSKTINSSDSLYYLGDTFALILPCIDKPEEALTMMKKMSLQFAHPLPIENKDVFIQFRMGKSIYPDDSMSAEDLLNQAMQTATGIKPSESARCHFYKDVSRY